MSLLARIKANYLAARKERASTVGALSALVGEVETKEKTFNPARPVTDEEVLAIVRKHIKGLDETLTALRGRAQARMDDIAKIEQEKALLEAYLPQQLAEADIERIATERKMAGDDMGKIMAHLKAQHPGQYDGKLASTVVKRVLS